MYSIPQIQRLANVVEGIHSPLATPLWERRTYGVFQGRELVGMFVSTHLQNQNDDCVEWDTFYRRGYRIFVLLGWDVTALENWKEVVGELKEQHK